MAHDLQQKKKKFLNRKTVIIICCAIVAITVAILLAVKLFGAKSDKKISTAMVTKGTVTKTIEGSGTIEANSQYNITSLVKGDVIADYFKEGDYIEKGKLMYKIDASDLNNNIQKANNDLEKAKIQQSDTVDSVKNLTVNAPISGVITNLYVKNGDEVSNNAKIADIVDKDKMVLKVNFITDDARNIYRGQGATVSLQNSFTTLSGQVTDVGTGSLVNNDGVQVTPVEIIVNNPGSIISGDKATAVVGNYACNDAGTFDYNNESTIVSKASGEVYNLNYKIGDSIRGGNVLLKLDNSSVNSSIKQGEISIKDSQLSIQNYYDQMDNYNIVAPISGKVIKKNIKAGEKLGDTSSSSSSGSSSGSGSGSSSSGSSSSSSSSSAMAIIADLSKLVLNMDVDELDINSIKVGQEVEITADAYEGKTFTGYVDNISIVGTSENGVTTYPVKVVINDGENTGLIPGINVTAKIVIEKVDNVLRVPAAAVQRGDFVFVKDSSGTKNSPASTGKKSSSKTGSTNNLSTESRQQKFLSRLKIPDGFKAVKVTTGLSDSDFIEIKSGLSEGQTVYIPNVQTTTTNSNNNMFGGPGMGGGMNGGMGGEMRSGSWNGSSRSGSSSRSSSGSSNSSSRSSNSSSSSKSSSSSRN